MSRGLAVCAGAKEPCLAYQPYYRVYPCMWMYKYWCSAEPERKLYL